jgi:hypothetical protein
VKTFAKITALGAALAGFVLLGAVAARPAAKVDPAPPPKPVVKKFPRGAKPTPRHKLLSAAQFRPVKKAPAAFAVVPPQLSMWDNDVDGDCVTAEEAFAKAAWAVMNGYPELFVPDAEVVRWATKYGFLNGADLTSVMDQMAKDGFTVNGTNYHDGPYQSVDYSNEAVLQAAIAQGPVKIGIDANALPSGAGNQQGWFVTGGTPGQFPNEDHCVALCGYGPAQWLYQQLGVPLPAGLNPSATGYLLFTWSTIGFVDHAWIMSTVGEAWVRVPTTPEQPNPTPVPPTPVPVPPNPAAGFTGSLNYVNGVLVSVTTGPATLEADLKSAGVNPMVIVDVLQLVADIRAKKPVSVIAADLLKIVTDLAPAEAPKKPAEVPPKKVGLVERAGLELAA